MADFQAERSLQEFQEWYLFHLSECLEDSHIRHCIAGDAILTAIGHPLMICRLYLAVADEQIEDALAVMLQQGLEKAQEAPLYVDEKATIAPLGWPGYILDFPREPGFSLAPDISLVPSSFWSLDLSADSLLRNTFLHPNTRCRFPTRLFYLNALISSVVKSSLESGYNDAIRGYFEMQYNYLADWLSRHFPDVILRLSPGNKFFVDLYGGPLPPKARQRVCSNREKIQRGIMTVEEAWGTMPVKFIETIKKIEEKRMAKLRGKEETWKLKFDENGCPEPHSLKNDSQDGPSGA